MCEKDAYILDIISFNWKIFSTNWQFRSFARTVQVSLAKVLEIIGVQEVCPLPPKHSGPTLGWYDCEIVEAKYLQLNGHKLLHGISSHLADQLQGGKDFFHVASLGLGSRLSHQNKRIKRKHACHGLDFTGPKLLWLAMFWPLPKGPI